MNIQAWIPLAATIAFVPLFIILIFNRPWQRQHKLLFWYMLSAILWSSSDFLFRGDFLTDYKLLVVKAVLWFGIWSAIQYLFIIRYFSKATWFKLPYIYSLLLVLPILEVLNLVPKGIVPGVSGIHVQYGIWYMLLTLAVFSTVCVDLYFLARRLNYTKSLEERNQISYLFAGVSALSALAFISFVPGAGGFPLALVGNLINAIILTYAVLRHRLLDLQFVFRRGLAWVGSIVAGLIFYLSLFLLIYRLTNVQLDLRTLTLSMLAAAVAGLGVYVLQGTLSRGTDRLFYKARYDYVQELYVFLKNRLSGIFDLTELSEELLPLLADALDCKQAYLFLPEPGSGDFVAEFGLSNSDVSSPLILRSNSSILERLKRDNNYLLRESLDILPEFQDMWDKEKYQLKALEIELLFPLVSRGNMVAILALGKKKSGKYSLEDIHLTETVTAHIATTLEKESFQEQLRKREQELALINRLSNIITSSLNIKDVYGAFIGELKQVVDVNWATIALIEGDELRFEVLSSEVGSTWQAGEKIPLKDTGTEWAANHRKALYEPDLSKNARFNTGGDHVRWGIRSIVYLPLVVKNEAIGSLVIASREPNAYTPSQVNLLERLASQIAVSVENSRLYVRAEQRARIDELTGLFNRRHFDESVKQEIDRHARYRSMLSLIFLDLDFFKAYNDMQGHTAGDKVLELIGQLISGALRNTDLAFRYGGDEFAIILPQSATNDAFVVAERVRGRIAAEMSKRDIKISASLGLASWPGDGVTSDELVNAADRALYYAKETRGNRTCVASKMLPSLTASATTRTTTEKEVLSIIHTLAATIEARDPNTYGHSRKVSGYAVSLAEAIGLPSDKVAVVSTAALLHDIGKIGIPDEVLNKVDKLEPEAWELIRAHPKLSTTIVGHVVSLVSCLPAILHHHERWDGNGYPAGLKGDEIPVEARVLAIADAFDAMTSSRPYRAKMSYKKVLQELKRCAGTQFDPDLIEAFLPIALSAAPEESSVA
jgi:diguanylate cyclase (GGDEF)-like protein